MTLEANAAVSAPSAGMIKCRISAYPRILWGSPKRAAPGSANLFTQVRPSARLEGTSRVRHRAQLMTHMKLCQ
ncbi:hypothetical protein SKAU_G00322460 [Synaphobranchus kaupii]|uniref:Uncharacterized protein n=1 Tax=Synaphobranchus kaupii TaxID=118154 RepID=A0A9Q1EP57_SYNKA|nr:hypothetical protein SKAU_G00322460 [Synaphobranchus kaupii]